jgi:hypothetical protein
MKNISAESPTKTSWLHILKEGGRWTTGEMSEVLGTDHCNSRGFLNSMVAAGSLKRFEPTEPGGKITFGVTVDCRVPMGVTLADLMQIGVVKESAQ